LRSESVVNMEAIHDRWNSATVSGWITSVVHRIVCRSLGWLLRRLQSNFRKRRRTQKN